MNIRNSLIDDPIERSYQESQLDDSYSYQSPLRRSDLLISVIIPVYNEENSIKEVIERIPNHQNYEIIIVDDGSTDNTLQKVEEIKDKSIRVVKHDKNLGYGAAILSGIKHADGDIIVTMDSDGQHNPEEIPNIIMPLLNDSADIVVGSRYLGKCYFKIPLITKIAEIVIKSVLWLLYGQIIHNNQNGFRAFSRKTLKIFDQLRYTGMGFTTEILFCSAFNGYKIKEIPIIANSRKHGNSYVKYLKTMKSILSLMLYYFLRRIHIDVNKLFLKRYIDKIYNKIKHLEIFQ